MEYLYDQSGVFAVKRGESTYFYRKDAQGNICALLDSNGNVVVEYVYDAWGNHAVLDANGADITDVNHIGVLNPFRYRSYYYDTETGLYYLKSRYYDPETGRFITIDGIEYLDPKTINGLNLYAYCGNNPVMYTDPTGTDGNSFWTDVGNWFVGVGNSIRNFFTRDIPNFFTKTIPDWWNGSVVPWWNNDVKPFFTQDIPNFFTKTIPDFFVNTFWKDWIVDKVWNQFMVGIIWQQGLLPAWHWLNGTSWYQIVVKNIVLTAISTGLGALIGLIFGPVGAAAGSIIGAVAGIVVGVLWDFGVSGINP